MPAEEYIVFSATIKKPLQEDDDAKAGHALRSLGGWKDDLGADESR